MPSRIGSRHGATVLAWRARVGVVLGLAALAGPAAAGPLERLVMPGPLAAAHAEEEERCASCHRAFDEGAEDALCLACHEPVALDVKAGAGLHGRLASAGGATCRSCHGDHRGRDADIVGLDPETFSHRDTDFPLEGAHVRVRCAACHAAGERHREAPTDCAACHRDDDPHRGQMEGDCGKCHDATRWAGGSFDHASTSFPLEGAHRDTDCALCHPAERYERTPSACAACHGADDVHAGRFGPRCGDCHTPAQWTRARFDHDARTDFPLRGRHRRVACDACHATPGAPAAASLDVRCVSCHRADDDHDGQNGADCGRCHGTAGWSRTRFDHARDAGWPLRGAHTALACERCHRAPADQVALEPACAACHGADDAHRGQLGRACAQCHGEASWIGDVHFDHDMAAFPLLGLHALAQCSDCHDGSTFEDAETGCVACHGPDDDHQRRLGPDCGRCHNPNGWEIWRFDHARETRFALTGAHRGIDCLACHTTPSRGAIRLSSSCGDCHALDDAHRGGFGVRCGDCHGTRSWKGAQIPR
jgi:hypothetical protein